jgi:hypothetical protein
MKASKPEIGKAIAESGAIAQDVEEKFIAAIKEFKGIFAK